MEKGTRDEKLKTAKRMLEKRVAKEQIAEFTELSIAEIEQIEKEIIED